MKRSFVHMTYEMYNQYMTELTPEMSVSELRAHLAEVLNEASYSGARTYITRAGRRIAAVVPVDEAELLESAEDAYLIQLAEEAKANQGDKPYKPLSQVLAELAAEDSGEAA